MKCIVVREPKGYTSYEDEIDMEEFLSILLDTLEDYPDRVEKLKKILGLPLASEEKSG